MPSKNVRIEGLEELVNSFNQFDRILDKAARPFLRDMGNWGVLQSQKEILSEGAVDTNELIQGMHYELGHLEVTIRPSDAADMYAWFVEEGSKPHWAPREALQGWADRHGIPVYLVQRKIALEGTEPRYIFQRTYEKFDDKVNSEAPRLVDDILRML